MTVAEQVYEIVKQLPEDKVAEVLAFAKSIEQQALKARISDAERMADWHRFLDSIDPADWEDFPSLEEIRSWPSENAPKESS